MMAHGSSKSTPMLLCNSVALILLVSLFTGKSTCMPTMDTSGRNVTSAPNKDSIRNNGTKRGGYIEASPKDATSFLRNLSMATPCRLSPVNPFLAARIKGIMAWRPKLIEYTFDVSGYYYNPLEANNTWAYKPQQWARVMTGQGQTIMNLAFNYGILSLMTLTFGVEQMHVELHDTPSGCTGGLSEEDKVNAILTLVLRDMDEKADYTVLEGRGSVCYQVIRKTGSRGSFTDRCCHDRLDGNGIECYEAVPNKWLKSLNILLACLTLAVFLFGPIIVPDWIYAVTMDTMEYGVILKEQLYKNLVICRRDKSDDKNDLEFEADHVLDLRNRRDFKRCRCILSELPSDTVIPIKIEQFDIMVNYRKLLPENRVPVGMTQSLSRALFLCKLRNLEPFGDCCNANVFGCCKVCKPRPWLNMCTVLGRVLLVLMMPIPFYIRLALYYLFEHPEIVERKAALTNIGLREAYNFRLMQFMTPTHPVFISAFIIYFSVGLVSAWFGKSIKQTRYQQGITDSFSDLKDMSWLNALAMAVRNLLHPFKSYGIFGCLIGAVIWPIFLPLSALICFIYCLPIVFLTCRILYHTLRNQDEPRKATLRKSFKKFELEVLMQKLKDKNVKRKMRENLYCSTSMKRTLTNIFIILIILFTLYSAMLMVAEVAGFLSEIICFTMMGLIVNASKVLRYGSLIFLVLIYSYDTYNNVNKKYLKLNKALFNEIQKRIKDLEEYTSLPSNLQLNRGFKACENSEQADYEMDDNLSDAPYSWDINDLILFVDSEDTPRIPKKLFEEVCAIQVAGSPGPVYQNLLKATGQFMIIIMFLVFVFLVVMSFGESYKISNTNQTIATLAGGFMPFLFTNMLKPSVPQVETGLVSFKSKLEEIIKNFRQTWPMYDFEFDVGEKPSSDTEEEEEEAADGEARGNVTCSDITTVGANNNEVKKPNADVKGNGKQGKDLKKKDNKKNNAKGDKNKNAGKDGKKNGKKSGKSTQACLTSGKPVSTTNELVLDIKGKVEHMELEPVQRGTNVDLLIMLSEKDQEWLMEWSSISDFKEFVAEYNNTTANLFIHKEVTSGAQQV